MPSSPREPTAGFLRARRKFLRVFPGGFRDETYLDWERDYKWESHRRWIEHLDVKTFRALLTTGRHDEIARRALKVEQQSRHSMVFTFEKIALREAVATPRGAKIFATSLFEFLHGRHSPERRFDDWVEALRSLPRRQARLVTWPVATVFGFLAQPDTHFFVKPAVTRRAALACGLDLSYRAQPSADIYANILNLAATVRRHDRHPVVPLGAGIRRVLNLRAPTPALEELLEKLAAFVGADAGDDVETVIERGMFVRALRRIERAGLRLRRAVDDRADARVHHRAHAHQARLDRDVQRRPRQPVVAEARGRVAHRDDFRVGRRIVRGDRLIASEAGDPAVDHHDGADGHLAGVAGGARFGERGFHPDVVIDHFTLNTKRMRAPAPPRSLSLNWLMMPVPAPASIAR